MIVATTNEIPGRPATKVLGIAKGTTVRARHLGRAILSWFKGLVGGEIHDYTKVIAEAREQAFDRMVEDARQMGANAILGVRYSSTEVMSGAAEIVVYGTAVSYGIDMKPVFQEVQRSNMSKVGGHKREDGKWVKPPTYSPADITPILEKQGNSSIQ